MKPNFILLACVSLAFASGAYAGFAFGPTFADASNTTGDGFGVGVEGFVDFNATTGNLEITLHNLAGTATGSLVGFGFDLNDTFSLTHAGSSSLVNLDANFPATPVDFTGLTAEPATSIAIAYNPSNSNTVSGLGFTGDSYVGLPNGSHNNHVWGLDSGKAARFLLPVTGADGTTTIDDIFNLTANWDLVVRFRGVSSVGGSTKLGIQIHPVPEPSAILALLTAGSVGLLALRRRR